MRDVRKGSLCLSKDAVVEEQEGYLRVSALHTEETAMDDNLNFDSLI